MFTGNEACYLIQAIQAELVLGNPNNPLVRITKTLKKEGKLDQSQIDSIFEQADVQLPSGLQYNLGSLETALYKLEDYCKEKEFDSGALKERAMKAALEEREKRF
jgi:hypothetical protein